MNEEKFKFLADKYLNGKISEAEEADLFHYYNQLQEYKSWQEELMGSQEMVKSRLYRKITIAIAKKNKVKYLYPSVTWRVAACAAVLLMIATWSHFKTGSFGKPGFVNEITKTAPAGHTLKISLSDGTKVFLNSGSKLTYPELFTGDTREINLTGEAYFEVAHLKKPFVIHSGKMLTQVLGTSFNVKAYENDKIAKVAVLTGKVGVRVEGSKQPATFLTANQGLTFNKHKNAVVKSFFVDAKAEIAWRKRVIKFRSTPFPEALEELNRIYHIETSCQPQLKNCLVFADFNYTDSPEKVLNMLAKSLNGTVENHGHNTYLITGRSCN
jgi:transmembrane sensor